MTKKLIISLPQNQAQLEVRPGENLLEVLRQHHIPVHAPCGGNGKCRNCRVEIRQSPDSETGEQVLACQTTVNADLIVYTEAAEQSSIQAESYFPDIPLEFNKPRNNTFGFSIDIGTTTVVVYLEDLEKHTHTGHTSFLNPQRSFGADVISRILYAKDEKHLSELSATLIREINQAFKSLLKKHNLQQEQISEVTIAGNTTMLHLLVAEDPSGMAVYPFDPAFIEEKTIEAGELGINLSSKTPITLLPSLSAFVGADIVAGIAATDLSDTDEYSLFLDIGTNGEMALGNKTRLWCCATAAGPAFEGAKISCGLGGVSGAIHQFTGEQYKTIGEATARGLCGSGLIDVIAWLLDTEQLDPAGYLEQPVSFLADPHLELTPQDIREVQLAKGAIAAGIQTLLEKASVAEDQVSRVFLAGGFGHAIREASAIRIGLLPVSFRKKVIRTGNTAGLGAQLYLHSNKFRDRVKKLAHEAEHFDLSADPYFNDQFVMNMYFPA